MPIKVGEYAPIFQLKDHEGVVRSLREFSGKKIILYFYPKDNTPGCIKEACSLRDGYNKLQDAGIVILGVSYDSPESHKKFRDKYKLPFVLLSDQKREVARAYGAARGLLGILMPKRFTYLINEAGILVHIFKDVDVKEHAEQILEIFTKLNES